jgi:hypothetical protein
MSQSPCDLQASQAFGKKNTIPHFIITQNKNNANNNNKKNKKKLLGCTLG